jgi:hypothetical protein
MQVAETLSIDSISALLFRDFSACRSRERVPLPYRVHLGRLRVERKNIAALVDPLADRRKHTILA